MIPLFRTLKMPKTFLILLLFLSCHKEKDNPGNYLIGTWAISSRTVSATVYGKTVEQYLIEEGYGQVTAGEISNSFYNSLVELYSGTTEFKPDSTFTGTIFGIQETGTWSMNSERDKMTLTGSISGRILVIVLGLNTQNLHVTFTKTFSDDIDNDGTPENAWINVDENLSK